ncbi:MAG: hypothetical protein MJ252_17735 [archaeon]|nr:hypothetical protein [archaeon]
MNNNGSLKSKDPNSTFSSNFNLTAKSFGFRTNYTMHKSRSAFHMGSFKTPQNK